MGGLAVADFERLTTLRRSFKGEYDDVIKRRSSSRIFGEDPHVVGYIWPFQCLDGLSKLWLRARKDSRGPELKGLRRARCLRERACQDRLQELQSRWAKDVDSIGITVSAMSGALHSIRATRDATAGELCEVLAATSGVPHSELALVCGERRLEDDDTLPVESLEGPAPHAQVVRSRRRRLLTGSHDSTLGLWDAVSHRRLATLRGHGDAVLSLNVDWATRRALTGSHDCRIKLWDLDHFACVATWLSKGHPAFCLAVDWSAKRAVSGSWDQSVRLWDLDSGEMSASIEADHRTPVLCMALDWPSRRALGGSQDELRLWDLEQRVQLWSIRVANGNVAALAADWPRNIVWLGSSDGYLSLWQLSEQFSDPPKPLVAMGGHHEAVSGVDLHPDKSQAVSSSWDGTLRRWQLLDPTRPSEVRCMAVLEHEACEALTCVAVDWSTLSAVSGSTRTLRLWGLESGEDVEPHELSGPGGPSHEDGISCVSVESFDVYPCSDSSSPV